MRWTGLLALVGACGGGNGSAPPPVSGGLEVRDEHNAALAITEEIAQVEVEAGADFCVDWSALTTDRMGRPFDPAAVADALLMALDLPWADVAPTLSANALTQSDAGSLWLSTIADAAMEACTGSFEIIGLPLDATEPGRFEEDPDESWLFALGSFTPGTTAAVGVTPSEASTNHTVILDDHSSSLTVTSVDLAGRTTLQAPAGDPSLVLDWSQLTTDTQGGPFDPILGDRLVVARFDGIGVDGVEEHLLSLDASADEAYTTVVFNVRDADLSATVRSDGLPFAGFTTEGTWVVAITCSSCWSPAPLLAAAVEVQ